MGELRYRCDNLEQAGFDAQRAAEETWEALLSAGVFVEGDFMFASGQRATLKADAERLYAKPRQLAVVMGHFATFPCVQDADVLLYAPEGMRQFTTTLGNDLGKPVVRAVRKPNVTSKYDFMFETAGDEYLAHAAEMPVVTEDVVTTLGSVAAMRRLLRPDQSVHSLAMLLRGAVDPAFQAGLVDHYLLEQQIPTDKEEFQRRLVTDDWL
jgi:hypothetical protein